MNNLKINMKKQTAVQWLQDSLDIHFSFEQQMQFEGLFQQALEIEKEQIENAYEVAYMDGYNDNGKDGKQYYNETYKI